MKIRLKYALAAALGAAIGIAWWLAYTPAAYSVAALIGAHAVAAIGLRLGLDLLGWDSRRSLVLAVLGGLVIVPAAITPLHISGQLGGPSGLAVDLVFVLAGCGLGGLVGRMWTLDFARKRAAFILAAMSTVLVVILVAVSTSRIPDDVQATAANTGSFSPDHPVLVFGIDGADWKVLDPLLAEDRLPNLAELIEGGRHGVLLSSEPMASPVVWTTIFTGVEPSTHGVSSWTRSDARSRTVPMVWDVYGVHEQRSVAVNVPGTWPPNEVAGGTLISGFPIPGIASSDSSHLTGTLVTADDTRGDVPTVRFESGRAEIPMATPVVEARLKLGRFAIQNQLIDTAARERFLPTKGRSLELVLAGDKLAGNFEGESIELADGAWSDWLVVRGGDTDVHVRIHRIDRTTLFVSPGYQSPTDPRHSYATGVPEGVDLAGDVPYVVEGIGWTAHRDERVDHLIPDMLLETQERQLQAMLDSVQAGPTPFLTAFVFTVTDRLQHPFWSLHEPDEYAGVWQVPPDLAQRDPVEDAYVAADAALGRTLAVLPEDTVVWIVSDHGVSSEDPKHHTDLGEAGHREDGIWIASGPGITPSTKRETLRVVDVTPSVLRCVDLPVAKDFEGTAAGFCSGDATVDTFVGAAGAGGSAVDDSQQAQLCAMGYVDC
ncbi:MAG: hypothetical protein GY913_35390 [Proteobacteria bacterium]|nr:hypothetical protein [Pseudomonadota bacterium]MCP4922216.1 hypothetical protein [Pseudomonadota bacterium]